MEEGLPALGLARGVTLLASAVPLSPAAVSHVASGVIVGQQAHVLIAGCLIFAAAVLCGLPVSSRAVRTLGCMH